VAADGGVDAVFVDAVLVDVVLDEIFDVVPCFDAEVVAGFAEEECFEEPLAALDVALVPLVPLVPLVAAGTVAVTPLPATSAAAIPAFTG
jgi:hypothetical protein